jgi:hypothetical protein
MQAEGVGFEPTRAFTLPVFKTRKPAGDLQPGATICKNDAPFSGSVIAECCIRSHANRGRMRERPTSALALLRARRQGLTVTSTTTSPPNVLSGRFAPQPRSTILPSGKRIQDAWRRHLARAHVVRRVRVAAAERRVVDARFEGEVVVCNAFRRLRRVVGAVEHHRERDGEELLRLQCQRQLLLRRTGDEDGCRCDAAAERPELE